MEEVVLRQTDGPSDVLLLRECRHTRGRGAKFHDVMLQSCDKIDLLLATFPQQKVTKVLKGYFKGNGSYRLYIVWPISYLYIYIHMAHMSSLF